MNNFRLTWRSLAKGFAYAEEYSDKRTARDRIRYLKSVLDIFYELEDLREPKGVE